MLSQMRNYGGASTILAYRLNDTAGCRISFGNCLPDGWDQAPTDSVRIIRVVGVLKEQGLLVVHTHHEKQVGRRIDESSPIVDARLPD